MLLTDISTAPHIPKCHPKKKTAARLVLTSGAVGRISSDTQVARRMELAGILDILKLSFLTTESRQRLFIDGEARRGRTVTGISKCPTVTANTVFPLQSFPIQS